MDNKQVEDMQSQFDALAKRMLDDLLFAKFASSFSRRASSSNAASILPWCKLIGRLASL